MIFLTTAIDVDRDGHADGGKIVPDQVVDAGIAATGDPTLVAAQAWLAPSCPR